MVVAVSGGGLRHGPRVHARRGGRPRRRLGSRGRVLPAGAPGRSRSARLQDRARARDAGRRRRCTPSAAGSSRKPTSSKRRCASIAGAGVRAVEPAAGAKAAEIERTLRERIEAATPRPEIERLREQAARRTASRAQPDHPEPLIVNFVNASIRDILTFIGKYTGINVTFDRDFQDRPITVKLEGVTLEQALQQIMLTNQLFYKVLNERTIIVAADSTQKRHAVRRAGDPDVLPLACRRDRVTSMLNGMSASRAWRCSRRSRSNKTTNTITVAPRRR